MGISIILAFFILTTTWKVVYTLTWKDPMHEHDGFGNAMSISVPLESAQDGYIHRVLIGNNGQEFKVMVTTSSTLLWVPKVGCKGSGSRRTYNPSPSFEEDGRNWTQKSYGGTTNGELGIDDVKIGGLLKPRCNFGMATNISTDTKLPVDGVLGLAPFADSSIPGQPFMDQIKDLLTSHMFTIYLSQQSGSNAGSVTYGSVNNDNCVTFSTRQAFVRAYYFKISSVSLGNFTHSYKDNAAPELIPFIIGPEEVINGLAKAAGATLINGSYEIRCNATIPKLAIKAERYGYSIRSNRLIVKKESRCVLALASQTGGGFGIEWYFGAPLLQEYCITFDLSTKNLEFRGTKSSPTTSSSTRRIPTTTPKNTTSSSTKTTRSTLYHHTRKKYHYLVNKNNSQNPDYYNEEDHHLYTENNSQNNNYYTKKKHYYFVNENNSQNPNYYTEEDHHLYTENNSQNTDYYTKKKHYYFVNENNSPNPNYYTKKNQHLLNKNDSQNSIYYIKNKRNHL